MHTIKGIKLRSFYQISTFVLGTSSPPLFNDAVLDNVVMLKKLEAVGIR